MDFFILNSGQRKHKIRMMMYIYFHARFLFMDLRRKTVSFFNQLHLQVSLPLNVEESV